MALKRIFIIYLILFGIVAKAEVPASAIRTLDKESICNTRTSDYRNVPDKIRKQIFKRQGIKDNNSGICATEHHCELDHRDALEVSGSNDPSNLVVASFDGPCNMRQKDDLEDKLHALICDKTINFSVAVATEILYNSWEDGYKKYVNPLGCNEVSTWSK
jgi:hypothetical protein